MKWLLNTTVGKATFSSGRKSRLAFRSCQQPRELHQGSQDAEKGTHSLLLSCQRGVTARRKRAALRIPALYPARRESARNRSSGTRAATRLHAELGELHRAVPAQPSAEPLPTRSREHEVCAREGRGSRLLQTQVWLNPRRVQLRFSRHVPGQGWGGMGTCPGQLARRGPKSPTPRPLCTSAHPAELGAESASHRRALSRVQLPKSLQHRFGRD